MDEKFVNKNSEMRTNKIESKWLWRISKAPLPPSNDSAKYEGNIPSGTVHSPQVQFRGLLLRIVAIQQYDRFCKHQTCHFFLVMTPEEFAWISPQVSSQNLKSTILTHCKNLWYFSSLPDHWLNLFYCAGPYRSIEYVRCVFHRFLYQFHRVKQSLANIIQLA